MISKGKVKRDCSSSPVSAGSMQAMWQRAGTAFRAKVGKELSGHGLLYEDVLIETDEVKLALSRLPKDIMNQREIRLKRAMVLSSQQKRLPPEVVAMQDPWKPYLSPYLDAIEAEKDEMKQLGISDGKSNFIGK